MAESQSEATCLFRDRKLILGVGNPFRRDDGIGPAVIQALQDAGKLQNVDLLDGGTDGFNLLDDIKGYDEVLVVDAVDMGMSPGSIRLFSPAEAKMTIQADALSTHGFGLAEVIALMETLDINTELTLLGVQVKDIAFGEEMSPEVSEKIPELLKRIEEYITTRI
jgi:hydrogenase maturation protease